MKASKPKVIKDYEKLDKAIREQIKLFYTDGFHSHLVYYNDKNGARVSALPFETDDRYYLVRMTVMQAKEIIDDDEDYDDEGQLKDNAKEKYEDKYSDLNYLADFIADNPEGDD